MSAERQVLSIAGELDGGGQVLDACTLTIDLLQLHDGAGGLVLVGGIGNVVTRPEFRRRGLATRLMRQAIEHMREQGCSASLLYGIDHFYGPLGWRSCGDERWVQIDVDAWREQASGEAVLVRAARADDPELLAEPYERVAATIPGAVSRRSSRAWSRFEIEGSLVAEREGVVVGWAWCGRGIGERDDVERQVPSSLAFAEFQAVDDAAMLAIIDAACDAARAAGAARIVTGANEAHRVRVLARAGRVACKIVDEVRPHGGAMLLPFDEAGRALLAQGDLYQFLPDRF